MRYETQNAGQPITTVRIRLGGCEQKPKTRSGVNPECRTQKDEATLRKLRSVHEPWYPLLTVSPRNAHASNDRTKQLNNERLGEDIG